MKLSFQTANNKILPMFKLEVVDRVNYIYGLTWYLWINLLFICLFRRVIWRIDYATFSRFQGVYRTITIWISAISDIDMVSSWIVGHVLLHFCLLRNRLGTQPALFVVDVFVPANLSTPSPPSLLPRYTTPSLRLISLRCFDKLNWLVDS